MITGISGGIVGLLFSIESTISFTPMKTPARAIAVICHHADPSGIAMLIANDSANRGSRGQIGMSMPLSSASVRRSQPCCRHQPIRSHYHRRTLPRPYPYRGRPLQLPWWVPYCRSRIAQLCRCLREGMSSSELTNFIAGGVAAESSVSSPSPA